MFAVIGQKIAAQLQATSTFVSANGGNNRVFPVRIPQTQAYPCTTYEIMDVDNFVSKNESLESCNVSIRLATFGESYTETYSQAKAAVLALDLFSVTYSDGGSYTAKFNFETLSDEYHNNAEVFYKNIIFNCLIIKN
tara:strand:+ start:449 stop:859 length:411 start_codon:yes stop_codon:yes gene_type:complete